MPSVLVYRSDLLGVSETFILAQARAMRSFQPHLFGLRRVGGLDLGGLPVHNLRSGALGRIQEILFRQAGFGPAVLRSARASGASLIHAHFATDATECLPIPAALKVPFVVTLHGSDVTLPDVAFRSSWRGRRFLSRRARLQAAASLFLCSSDFIRNQAEAAGYPAGKLAVQYIGVDTQKLLPGPAQDRDGTILFVGRLVAQKGLTYLLNGLAGGGEKFTTAQVVVIGDGPLRQQHQAEAARLGVRVRFLGAQPSPVVYEWMRRSAVLVLPSIREGLGIVLCEAIALGLPVIGFASGGIPEVIAEGCGLLAAEADPYDLGKQLALLLENAELRARFASNARHRLVKKFDLAAQTRRLEDRYSSLISAKDRIAKPELIHG